MSTYTPTIGLEIHSELKTKSKMFCGCKNNPHESHPNAHTCPVCLAHPGSLPTVNKEAVKKVLLVGEALNGEIATYSEFDRKQYFYPDIPKAYQLSQYAFPFVKGGELAGVKITRVHLEEDTARSQHNGEDSIVDFNRAGVPLMELVTEPVIHSAKDATNFAKELQLLLRTIGASDANMEKGEMRVEANISISDTGELGTKVEVKNLNSFKSVEQAIVYEVERQKTLKNKGKIVIQETRGWDEAKNKTFSQRSKEVAEEYRYFPDPDIPKYDLGKISDFSKSRLAEILPEIPSKIRDDLSNLGLPREQVETLVYNQDLLLFFQTTLGNLEKDGEATKMASNYVTSDLVGLMTSEEGLELNSENAIHFAALVKMIVSGDINSRVAKDLLKEVAFGGMDPEKLAKDKGLLQNSSEESLRLIVDKILAENPAVVEEYKAGKESSLQYLIGQGMKLTKGTANPGVMSKLLKENLGSTS